MDLKWYKKRSEGIELLPFLCCFQGQPNHSFTKAANSSVASSSSLPLLASYPTSAHAPEAQPGQSDSF